MKPDEIDEAAASCKKQFLQYIKKGQDPFPTGVIFSDVLWDHDESAIMVITMQRHIESPSDLEELAEHVRTYLPKHAVAAGMIFYADKHTWSSLQKKTHVASSEDGLLDFVGVAHIEHVTDGYQTWTLDLKNMTPSPEGWKLRSSGHSTEMPNLIPPAHYETYGQA